jgi:hypothetical protein
MTTYAEQDTRTTSNWPLFAALGAGTALVLSAVATFWDITGNDTVDRGSAAEILPVVGVVLVATVIVFGFVVRTASPASAAIRSVILAVLGFLSLIVFWAGLPPVLAFGAIALASTSGRSDGLPVPAKVAVGISVLTLALAVWAAIAG